MRAFVLPRERFDGCRYCLGFLSFFARTVMSNLGRTGGHRWAGGQWEKKGRVDVREGVREGRLRIFSSVEASQPAQPALVSSSSSSWQMAIVGGGRVCCHVMAPIDLSCSDAAFDIFLSTPSHHPHPHPKTETWAWSRPFLVLSHKALTGQIKQSKPG